jgi:hypothetical protein
MSLPYTQHQQLRFFRSRQALILGTPGGAVAAAMTLFCGWYSDKKVSDMICHAIDKDLIVFNRTNGWCRL